MAFRKAGWCIPSCTTAKKPSGARSAARGPITPRASDRRVNATLGDPILMTTCRTPGVESAVNSRQDDGGDAQGPDCGDAVGRIEREAERPHPAQRGTHNRRALDPQRVEQRRELSDRVSAQRSSAVIERVAEPEPGQVERDGAVAHPPTRVRAQPQGGRSAEDAGSPRPDHRRGTDVARLLRIPESPRTNLL